MTRARDLADFNLDGKAVTINESSADLDFRVESNGNANMLVVDGGNDRVGIGEASPAAPLHISTGASTTTEIRLTSNNTGSGSGDRGRIAVHSSRNDGTAYEAGRIDIDRSSGTEDKAHILFATNDGSSVAERMRIVHTGDVGIGRTNPEGIVGSHGGGLVVQSTSGRASSTTQVAFQDSSGNNQFELQHGGLLIHRTGSSERMRSMTDGVLVGCTTTDTNNSTGIRLFGVGTIGATRDNEYSGIFRRGGSDGGCLLFRRDSNSVGGINVTSSSTSYVTSSDARLKENVTDLTGAIDRVKALAPKRFNFIVDADTTVDGFLAHEAQTVVPEAVTGTYNEVETWTQQQIDDGDAPDGTSAGDNKLDEDGNTIPVYQGIDQAKLVPLLTAALREAIAKIETLETKVAALEAE